MTSSVTCGIFTAVIVFATTLPHGRHKFGRELAVVAETELEHNPELRVAQEAYNG